MHNKQCNSKIGVIVFLWILNVKHIYNRLTLTYRKENKLVLIVLIFFLVVTPSTTFTKFSTFKILFTETTSFGAFFPASASNKFLACDWCLWQYRPSLVVSTESSFHPHSFKMIGRDNLKVASRHILENSIINQ